MSESYVDMDSYQSMAEEASQGTEDIQTIYANALAAREASEQADDLHYIKQSKEYVELRDHIESSTTMLDSLESFLSTFQNDLSSVSGHISELQNRSRTIESRLQSRKKLESTLGPAVNSLVLPPDLITLILDTIPDEKWLPAIAQLDMKLSAIRSGPRVEARKSLDVVSEKLRIKATEKLRQFFIDLLTPYRTSISTNIQVLQSSSLMKYRDFFTFLQRHAARQAHEVQKYYVSTVQWYYETGFRRYTRALEKIRLRSSGKDEASSSLSGGESSLNLLAGRNASMLTVKDSVGSGELASSIPHAAIEGPPVLLAYMADVPKVVASPEALFRSVSLVMADNAASEFDFMTNFFGAPADRANTESITSNQSDSSKGGWDMLSRSNSYMGDTTFNSLNEDDFASQGDAAETASISTSSEVVVQAGRKEQRDRMKKSAVDTIWKQVYEPVLEYCRSFVTGLLEGSPPSTVGLLTMIRLNDAVFDELITQSKCPTSQLESHLVGLKLQLWPLFQKDLDNQIEAMKKMAESAKGSTGVASVFGNRAGVKDAAVQDAMTKYLALFDNVVQLSREEDEEMVFSRILRLRNELQKVMNAQAGRLPDRAKSNAYLSTQYETMLSGISASEHSGYQKTQAEISHWRELARRATIQ